MASYVKFVRGTPAAFKKATKNADTLYFVSEADSSTGLLYLGEKLISGGTVSTTDSSLGNVIISNIGDSQLLVYDENAQAWTNKSVLDAISIMQGATENMDGISGLVPQPHAYEKDLFLRGDGTWSQVPANAIKLDEKIFTQTDSGELTLVGSDMFQEGQILQVTKNIENGSNVLTWVSPSDFFSSSGVATQDWVKEQISAQSHLTRKIVESVNDIDVEAEDAENYLYMVKQTSSDTNNVYNEYIVVNKAVELIGSTASNLIDYVTLKTYKSEVGDLSELTKLYGDTTAVDQIIEIKDQLKWQELEE